MLSAGIWMIGICLIARALRPGIDLNGWPFLLRMFPIWSALLLLTLYAFAALQVRLLIRRKGALRAMRYLFPEALSRKENWLDRSAYRLLGVREMIQNARGELAGV